MSDKEKSFITPAQRYPSPTATARTDVSPQPSPPPPQSTKPSKPSSSFDLNTSKGGRVPNKEIEEWKMKLRSPIEDLDGESTASKVPLPYTRKSTRSPNKHSSTPSKPNPISVSRNEICPSSATPTTIPIPVSQSTLLSHREEKKQNATSKDRIKLDLSTGRLSNSVVAAAAKRKQEAEKEFSPLNQQNRQERSREEPKQLPHSTVTHVDKPVVMTTRISKRILVNFFSSVLFLLPKVH